MAYDQINSYDASGNLLVTLGTQLAGEDQTNNIMTGGAKTVTTTTQGGVSVGASAQNSSASVASGIYRKYRVAGAGSSGNIDVKLEWSPDNGVSGWYYVNNSGSNQYPLIVGDVIAPYVRVTVTNQAASTQTISAYLVLSS